MKTTYCLDCDRSIKLDKKVSVGSIVECRHCESEFQVIHTSPVELDWTYVTAQTWEQASANDAANLNNQNETDLWSWLLTQKQSGTEYGRLPKRGHNRKGHHRNSYEHAF